MFSDDLNSDSSIEKELDELRKSALDFATVGDAKEAIETDEINFMGKFEEVKKHFKYISYNTHNDLANGEFDDKWLEACDIVGEIETQNPSLKKWVAKIIALEE